MQSFAGLAVRILFVLIVAILFTIFVVVRPDASRTPSIAKWLGIACVGVVIGLIFLDTTSLYTPQ